MCDNIIGMSYDGDIVGLSNWTDADFKLLNELKKVKDHGSRRLRQIKKAELMRYLPITPRTHKRCMRDSKEIMGMLKKKGPFDIFKYHYTKTKNRLKSSIKYRRVRGDQYEQPKFIYI